MPNCIYLTPASPTHTYACGERVVRGGECANYPTICLYMYVCVYTIYLSVCMYVYAQADAPTACLNFVALSVCSMSCFSLLNL